MKINKTYSKFPTVGTVKKIAAILVAATIILPAMGKVAHSQQTLWYVVINSYATPPKIGVAPVNWSSNGWIKHAGPYYSAAAAWNNACGMHASGNYYSDDIAENKVSC